MGTRLVEIERTAMACTVISYDESGQPVYANDPRLGNRRKRRHLLLVQRRLTADVRT